jgi:hypothetical protein
MLTFWEKVKRIFWHAFEPLFPTTRDTLMFLGLMEHDDRQRFSLGWLRPGVTDRDVRATLKAQGFSDDYLAWIDPEETLNMRKLVEHVYQYHVRVFNDGEVRGHHEFSTESHPFKHLFEKGMTEGADYLKALLAPLLQDEPTVHRAQATPSPK